MKPILYTQAGCAESARVRTWLVEHGVLFCERDTSSDPAAAQALAATGTFATPLLVRGDDRVLGFRKQALAALLGNSEEPASLIGDGGPS
jgi:arsenate reductase-like glutaredoxin family protein